MEEPPPTDLCCNNWVINQHNLIVSERIFLAGSTVLKMTTTSIMYSLANNMKRLKKERSSAIKTISELREKMAMTFTEHQFIA